MTTQALKVLILGPLLISTLAYMAKVKTEAFRAVAPYAQQQIPR